MPKNECFRGSLVSAHLIIPHGSYLLNLGSPREEVREKSRELLLDELQRCEKLGIQERNSPIFSFIYFFLIPANNVRARILLFVISAHWLGSKFLFS
jgi:hypothetical protein